MTFGIRIFILIVGTFIFMMILELVRRRKFREDLSVVWLLIGVALIFASFADRLIDPLAHKLGISYPPALGFLIIIFLLVIATLYFSIIVSDLKSRNKELSQKIALLEYKLNRLYSREEGQI
ncbi:MAG: DUF2304 domain-containing protein [Nitrospirota bacterium]